MSTMTDAFLNATGNDPTRMGHVIALSVGAVLLVLVAYLSLRLWDACQDGQLSATTAKQYGMRAAVLAVFLLVVLRW